MLTLPTGTYRRTQPVFERAIASSSGSRRVASRTERAVFLVFGAGLFAVGPVLWMLVSDDPDGQLVSLLAGGLTGVFGLLLVWYGVAD